VIGNVHGMLRHGNELFVLAHKVCSNIPISIDALIRESKRYDMEKLVSLIKKLLPGTS
jgi:hypothetical protein